MLTIISEEISVSRLVTPSPQTLAGIGSLAALFASRADCLQ